MKLQRTRSSIFAGYYNPTDKIIKLNIEMSANELISTFFHELAHFLDHRDGLFKTFYSNSVPKYVIRRMALKAERHADKRGAKECKKYFPKVKFMYQYRNAFAVDMLRRMYQDYRKPLTPSLRKSKV